MRLKDVLVQMNLVTDILDMDYDEYLKSIGGTLKRNKQRKKLYDPNNEVDKLIRRMKEETDDTL